jgi:molybdopterin-binding protein
MIHHPKSTQIPSEGQQTPLDSHRSSKAQSGLLMCVRRGVLSRWGLEHEEAVETDNMATSRLSNERTLTMRLSARNQLQGNVIKVNKGGAIANVEIDVAGQRLVASVTVEAVEELGLSEGTPVTAVIKASDVIVATD